MGVYFVYFRAEDDEHAEATHALPGGPLGGDEPGFDGIETKAVFPDPHVAQLVARVAGVPYERSETTSWGLWPPPDTPPPVDESSLWLTDPGVERLATRVRDVLAGLDAADVARIAAAWADDVSHPVDAAAEIITRLAGLARRARDGGQELYCWSSL